MRLDLYYGTSDPSQLEYSRGWAQAKLDWLKAVRAHPWGAAPVVIETMRPLWPWQCSRHAKDKALHLRLNRDVVERAREPLGEAP